jgi:putative FmdB family regulatory protein
MPYYDFDCSACGSFTELRPMARACEPCDCPDCGQPAPRGFFTAPVVLGMDGARRKAHAVNEESRSSPKLSGKSEKYSMKHGAGCSCCSGGKTGKGVFRADGAKTFPSARPWMISH